MTTLLPRNLWRKQYDFTLGNAAMLLDAVVYVVVVLETRLSLTIEILPSADSRSCTDIPGKTGSLIYLSVYLVVRC